MQRVGELSYMDSCSLTEIIAPRDLRWLGHVLLMLTNYISMLLILMTDKAGRSYAAV